MKYKNKPFTIDAIQWTGDNEEEIEKFIGANHVQFVYEVLDGYTVKEVKERPRTVCIPCRMGCEVL